MDNCPKYHGDQPQQGSGRDPEWYTIEKGSENSDHFALVPYRGMSNSNEVQMDTDYSQYQGLQPKRGMVTQSQESVNVAVSTVATYLNDLSILHQHEIH